MTMRYIRDIFRRKCLHGISIDPSCETLLSYSLHLYRVTYQILCLRLNGSSFFTHRAQDFRRLESFNSSVNNTYKFSVNSKLMVSKPMKFLTQRLKVMYLISPMPMVILSIVMESFASSLVSDIIYVYTQLDD